jgi:2,4-dienoyl-CoA reductase-like NADH-dependent reductase (Old Yellow Enzyme family)
MYSSPNGYFTDWHLAHLGSFARGGVALVFTEATAVVPEGRITPWDAGLWEDGQIAAMERVASFVKANGAAAGIQLAHAGRKASTYPPFMPKLSREYCPPSNGGWQTVGASPISFQESWPAPRELSLSEIADIKAAFVAAAKRADKAGFDVIELHAAHGYLLSSFHSPLSNQRKDQYGGSFDNRVRLTIEIAQALREAFPASKPLFVRLTCSDWVEGGWTIEDTCRLVPLLKPYCDVIDCSSGGNSAQQRIVEGPGYQVTFARAVRQRCKVPTGAVGKIVDARQAEQILVTGDADLVFLARELLREPHWALKAAHQLGSRVQWPLQYERARL